MLLLIKLRNTLEILIKNQNLIKYRMILLICDVFNISEFHSITFLFNPEGSNYCM